MKTPVAALTTAANDKARDRVENAPAAHSPLVKRIAALQERADTLGPADPVFDQKAFSDWMESDR